jgi:predicted lipoprotein with Yx(FWY)xxD motif
VKARVSFAIPLALLALMAVVIAGCGGSSSSSATGSAAAVTPASSGSGGGSATVDVADNPQLGKILVDSKGNTLYTFQKDTGTQSMCAGSCASIWPPLTTSGHPTGSGVSAGMLGTTKRSDGSTQVTFGGHPLYTYTADSGPGQTTGNGIDEFGGIWNAVQPSGAKAPMGGSSGGSSSGTGSTSAGGGTSTSSGGYGY